MHTLANLREGLLHQTRELRLSEAIATFPAEILNLAETLEVLDLSGNNLSELPDDFCRLKKLKILFLSNNQFEEFPSVLATLPELTMIGFRNNQMKSVPEHSLPCGIRWLILTDNQISSLPDSIGQLVKLQKLMLAGNLLTDLPDTMAQCKTLQLLRVSANRLKGLPDFLFSLPELSWLAFAGNPFCDSASGYKPTLPAISWSDLNQQEVLGQGASGIVSEATWLKSPAEVTNPDQAIVVKKYKGTLTSDGYSMDELAACIAADTHQNLIPLVAQVNDKKLAGLVMERVDDHYENLGHPPNLQSCTRDQFDDGFKLTPPAIHKIAAQVTDTMLHLLDKKISHGDLYAHNILINPDADIILSDFGAASFYKPLEDSQQTLLQKIEVRAFGCLLEDLLQTCDQKNSALLNLLSDIKTNCLQSSVSDRPTFNEIKSLLANMHSPASFQSVT